MKYDSGTYRTNIKYKEQTEKSSIAEYIVFCIFAFILNFQSLFILSSILFSSIYISYLYLCIYVLIHIHYNSFLLFGLLKILVRTYVYF